MIRVIIADDHAIVRHGLRQLLGTAEGIEVVGETVDGRATLNAFDTLEADVLLLDLSLPRVNGIEVLRRLREQKPSLAILVLSMYPEEQYAPRLFELGAAGYLSKNTPSDQLLKAVRQVARGERCFPTGMLQSGGGELKAPHTTLSAREYQVFTLLLHGRAVADIAAELNVGSSTVSNHVAAIRNKLGVKSIVEIVRYGVREGLVDDLPVHATEPE